MSADFLTVAETARTLGVSIRHARRLADSGAVTRITRGLVDRGSVERYVQSQRQGRTRAWAEHTAWGAVALLSDQEAQWLGASQASRLRSTLRSMRDADELITRMRDRAQVRTFEAHRAAIPHLREQIASSELQLVDIAAADDTGVDGYLAQSDLDTVVHALGLREAASGAVVLRTTGFDIDLVRDLVASTTVAALDAATSTDPRQRGVGRKVLGELLLGYR